VRHRLWAPLGVAIHPKVWFAPVAVAEARPDSSTASAVKSVSGQSTSGQFMSGRFMSGWPPPRRRSRDRAADRGFAALGLALGVGLVIHQLNEQWSWDVFVHIAAIREFAERGLSPNNPFTGADVPDAYLTPFHGLAGALMAGSGLGVSATLTVLAAVNLAVLLAALRAVARLVSSWPWTPFFALVFTLLAWGVQPWRFSGYPSLNSLGYGLAYPSVFAIGVGLFAVVGGIRFLRGETAWWLPAVTVGGAVAALCHPLSTSWLVGLGAGFVVATVKSAPRRRALALAAACAVAALLVLSWPFFSVLDVARESGSWEGGNESLYRHLPWRVFLAAPGALALFVRHRRNRLDPLVLAAAFIGLVYLSGVVLDRGTLGRALPGLMLVAHLAMADAAGGLVERRASLDATGRRMLVGMVAVIVAVGLVGSAPGVVRMVPRGLVPSPWDDDDRLDSVVDAWEPLDGVLGEAAVVVAPDEIDAPVAAYGGHVLVSPAPTLRPGEYRERAEARRAILDDPGSPRSREAIERFGVTHVITTRRPETDDEMGRVVAATDRYTVREVGS
jgi:hypothetical protein